MDIGSTKFERNTTFEVPQIANEFLINSYLNVSNNNQLCLEPFWILLAQVNSNQVQFFNDIEQNIKCMMASKIKYVML